jgi:hypothetical protein
MKIIRYLSDPIKNLYNRMGRKLKFAVWLIIAASIGWLVYDTNGPLSGADATDIMAP